MIGISIPDIKNIWNREQSLGTKYFEDLNENRC